MSDDTLYGGFRVSPEMSAYDESLARRQSEARRHVRGEAYIGPSQPLDEPNADGFHPVQNVGKGERWGSVVGGAALLWAGLRTGRLNGLLLGGLGASLLYRGVSGHCMAYEALGVSSAEHPEATAIPAQQGAKVEQAVQIANKTPQELYAFWRNLENLPRVLHHLERIEVLSDTRSRWTASGPLGTSLSWEAEIFNEHEPEMIAWRSLPGSQVETAGSVHFTAIPGDRGTAVSISLKYNPPLGKLAANVASFVGAGLEHRLAEDLRRFKSIMETGEAPRTKGQPTGKR